MNAIADYKGTFLNHLEGLYQPKDRDLAVELAEAMGLAVQEVRFTATSRPLLSGHFNPEDKDPTNNVIFLYEMPEVSRRVVDIIADRVETDPELKEAMATYRAAAEKMPPIMPHFGVRYGTDAELVAVRDRLLGEVSPELRARVSIFEVPHYDPVPGLPDIRQIFVRTDVLTIGTSGFEQAIELQAVREG